MDDHKSSVDNDNMSNTICITDFILWFEHNIMSMYRYDLSDLIQIILELRKNYLNLMELSQSYRQLASTSSITQPARIFKLCDQIDSLSSIEAFSPKTGPFVLYPDDDFIKELVTKLRNKTNVIDDMASSTKLNRNSSNLEAAKDIRNCVHVIAMNLDELDECHTRNALLCSHFSELKEKIHKPIIMYINKLTMLLPEQSQNSQSNMDTSHINIKKLEEDYVAIRSLPDLENMAKCKYEMEYLERSIGGMLKPLRFAMKALQSTNQLTGTQASQIMTKLHTQFLREKAKMTNKPWFLTLKPFLQFSVSDADVLTKCYQKESLEAFVSSTLELQESIASLSKKFSDKNIRVALSKESSGNHDSKHGKSSTSNNDDSSNDVIDSTKAIQQLNDTSDNKMNLGFPIEIIEGVQVFDIELFVAYFEDWKERFDFALAQKANPAFIENCSKLRKIRSALEAAAIAKEQELANQRLLEEQYTFILSTFEFLQDSVQEICLRELNSTVKLTLPKEFMGMLASKSQSWNE